VNWVPHELPASLRHEVANRDGATPAPAVTRKRTPHVVHCREAALDALLTPAIRPVGTCAHRPPGSVSPPAAPVPAQRRQGRSSAVYCFVFVGLSFEAAYS
jgi:hypothetical protein